MAYIISVDQSTQSTKALLFKEDGSLVASSALSHAQIYPREGWVEHDPEVLYANTVAVIRNVVEKAGCKNRVSLADIDRIGKILHGSCTA